MVVNEGCVLQTIGDDVVGIERDGVGDCCCQRDEVVVGEAVEWSLQASCVCWCMEDRQGITLERHDEASDELIDGFDNVVRDDEELIEVGEDRDEKDIGDEDPFWDDEGGADGVIGSYFGSEFFKTRGKDIIGGDFWSKKDPEIFT